ncbi:hypothetical protein LSG31_02810 [Fodinisporobacter ferrooxydans]|uniref:Uncharacterized protein n=1 Tax=Fodinisporobacter ferrooxydans TaxID=2901836 RepID=A0ABY4CPP0_9BACL|nr:hypothetical protein LSG31_02810 [Alicyclobacillaceae bacterium MYW30-H2]
MLFLNPKYLPTVRSHNPLFTASELSLLNQMKMPWDNQLLQSIRGTERKVFQEQILELLIKDLLKRMD